MFLVTIYDPPAWCSATRFIYSIWNFGLCLWFGKGISLNVPFVLEKNLINLCLFFSVIWMPVAVTHTLVICYKGSLWINQDFMECHSRILNFAQVHPEKSRFWTQSHGVWRFGRWCSFSVRWFSWVNPNLVSYIFEANWQVYERGSSSTGDRGGCGATSRKIQPFVWLTIITVDPMKS